MQLGGKNDEICEHMLPKNVVLFGVFGGGSDSEAARLPYGGRVRQYGPCFFLERLPNAVTSTSTL